MFQVLYYTGSNRRRVKRMLQLTIPEIILRLVLAMVMGGAIGFERQYKNRPAGMRTHILVCMGAAIIALIQSQIAINALKDALANPALTGSFVQIKQG